MANEFKIEIPIETKGKTSSGNSSGGSNYEKQLLNQQKNSTGMLGGILKATAIVAAIWVALSPILTPLLKLLSLLALIVFLPLLPYMKEIAKKIGDTIKAVKDGQENGDSPMSSFTGGLGALFGDVTFVGTAIGVAFGIAALAALSGPAILGALSIALGTAIIFNSIGKGELENKLGAAGIIGLAAGIAAGIATGSPIVGTLFGAVTFGLAMSILPDGIELKKLKTALKAAGLIGIATALAVGIATGNPIFGMLAGSLVFILSLLFDLTREEDPYKDLEEMDYDELYQGTRQFTGHIINPKLQNDIDNVDLSNYISNINDTEQKWVSLNDTSNIVFTNMTKGVNSLSYEIGDTTNKTSLSTNLIDTSNEFVNMSNVSNTSVNNIISSLNRIPKKITTVHEIVTVRKNKWM